MRRLYGYVAITPLSFSFPLINSFTFLFSCAVFVTSPLFSFSLDFLHYELIYKISLRLYRKHLIHLFLNEVFHLCERLLETKAPNFLFLISSHASVYVLII